MSKVRIDNADHMYRAIGDSLDSLGAFEYLGAGRHVFLKPNLTYPTHRPGITTSPRLLRAVLSNLADSGCHVSVGESDGGYGAWSADEAFAGHGLRDLCGAFGATLVNLSQAPSRQVELETLGKTYRLGLPVILLDETDTFITLPVPKIHAMVTYSGAVKNQWGCIPDPMRLKLHPNFEKLIWAVNQRLAPRLAIGDGEYMLDRNGPMSGEPVYMNRIIVADDVLSFDVAVLERIMQLDPARVSYLALGRQLGFQWSADTVENRATGLAHQFELRRTLRNRLVAAAFPRQWAVNLIWDSLPGRLAHRVLYTMTGNPVERERERVLAMTEVAASERVLPEVSEKA